MSDHIPSEPAPHAAPASRFLGDKTRSQLVPLDWPKEVDGVTYSEILCERLTARELEAFYDLPPGERAQLPTIKAPHAVVSELDADDADRVWEVALGFLPLRMLPDLLSDRLTSASSSPSSPAS